MKGSGLTLNLKYLLFIFLLISLQSCGYNLRESPSFLSNKNIAVISDSNSLNRLFVEELRKANNNVLIYKKEEINDLDLIININNHQTKRFSSGQGAGARTLEVRVDYNLDFSLENPMTSNKTYHKIKDVKYLAYDDSQILAMETEEKDTNIDFIQLAIKKIEILSSTFKE